MKFGPVPLDQASGAVLAHSVATSAGRLRKGLVLGVPQITQLAADGFETVVVAQYETDDVGEDAAATLLAAAVTAPSSGLVQSNAFTGRVNLLAPGPGVAVLDVAALDAVNAVHPMITLATVPPFQQMAQRGMVATIKIISYAVPRDAIEKACLLAQRAIGFAPPQISAATLIVTEISGGAGEKGVKAISDRLNALDVSLRETIVVPHEVSSLATALDQTKTPLVLILTGSATSDIADVAPEALRLAGGVVERFGMPVDPGNLLFIGRFENQQVIGLPGCARSPALNGADWILSRCVCGVKVTGTDIARMGVGGLLKEIPTRPQPRSGKLPAH